MNTLAGFVTCWFSRKDPGFETALQWWNTTPALSTKPNQVSLVSLSFSLSFCRSPMSFPPPSAGVLSSRSVEFPQIFQLFRFHLGIATRKKNKQKKNNRQCLFFFLTVVQWQTSFLCSVILPLFFSGKIQPGGRPEKQGLTGDRSQWFLCSHFVAQSACASGLIS